MTRLEGLQQFHEEGVVELHRHLHLVLQRFVLLALAQVVALHLPNELYCVELAVLVAAGQVHLAEASDRKAVINLIFERILG